MAKFIVVLSGKGGAGKTTSSINLGLAMTKLGKDVIVLEGNLSSPNLSVHLGPLFFPVTIHDVMHRDEPIQNAIHLHETGLKIIPADISIDSMRLVNFENLKTQMQDLHLHADYVIIDGSPGLGKETTHLIDLADEVLIITNPDKTSIVDAKRLIEFVKRRNKTITGLVLNKHRNKKYLLKEEEIEKYLGLQIICKIPYDYRFEKTIYMKKPYIYMYPKRKPSKEYAKLSKRITGKA